jgi:hypothetical protein
MRLQFDPGRIDRSSASVPPSSSEPKAHQSVPCAGPYLSSSRLTVGQAELTVRAVAKCSCVPGVGQTTIHVKELSARTLPRQGKSFSTIEVSISIPARWVNCLRHMEPGRQHRLSLMRLADHCSHPASVFGANRCLRHTHRCLTNPTIPCQLTKRAHVF